MNKEQVNAMLNNIVTKIIDGALMALGFGVTALILEKLELLKFLGLGLR